MEQNLNLLFDSVAPQTKDNTISQGVSVPKVGFSLFDAILAEVGNEIKPVVLPTANTIANQPINLNQATQNTVPSGQPTIPLEVVAAEMLTENTDTIIPELVKSNFVQNEIVEPEDVTISETTENLETNSPAKVEAPVNEQQQITQTNNKINIQDNANETVVANLQQNSILSKAFIFEKPVENNAVAIAAKVVADTSDIIAKSAVDETLIEQPTQPQDTPAIQPQTSKIKPVATKIQTTNEVKTSMFDMMSLGITDENQKVVNPKEILENTKPISVTSGIDNINNQVLDKDIAVTKVENKSEIINEVSEAVAKEEPVVVVEPKLMQSKEQKAIRVEFTINEPKETKASEPKNISNEQIVVIEDTVGLEDEIKPIILSEKIELNKPNNVVVDMQIIDNKPEVVAKEPIILQTQTSIPTQTTTLTDTTQTPKIVSLIDEIISADIAKKSEPQEALKQTEVLKSVNVVATATEQEVSQKDSVLNSIFLSSQKSSANIASMMIASEAKKVLNNGETTVGNIKKSANLLNLGLQSIAEVKQELKNTTIENVVTKEEKTFESHIAARVMFITKEIISELNLSENEVKSAQLGLEQNVATLKVSDGIVNSFESKIIGARQQINSMMGDVARTMYENYKPPVTAFRLALNPGAMGSIAIVLKNDKTTMDISMSMTNANTLETFVDNQAALKNQIAKTFGDNSNININFSMQNDGTNQNNNPSSNGNRQQNNRFFNQNEQVVDESLKEEIQENSKSYM